MSNRSLFKSALLSTLWLAQFVFAEGTKQLRPTASDSTSIQIKKGTDTGSDFATYDGPVDYRLNVRVCEIGEVICLGFQKKSKHTFRLIAPNGDIVINTTSLNYASATANGYIHNYNEAVEGPNLINAAGYKPITYTATQEGDYYIEFDITGTIPNTDRYIGLFDVTVLRNNAVQDGRLWSKSWLINVQSSSNTINAKLFVYTSDQIVSRLEFNGARPYEFNISCNSTGVKKTGIVEDDRKSVYENSTYPEFPIFLNDPDIKCFPTGVFGDFVGTPSFVGCGNNSCVNVEVNKAGTIQVALDLDNVVGYQDNGLDVLLSKTVTAAGKYCISWDGKDGSGQPVSFDKELKIKIAFLSGLTHLPLYDMEQNPNGFKVFYVRPAAPTAQVQIPLYWDDSDINASGGVDTKVNTTTGCVSASGCHKWTGRGAEDKEETINTWWIAETKEISITANFTNISIDANKLKPGKGNANDDLFCGDGSAYQLNATFSKASGIQWSTSGTGMFSNLSDTSALYTPSVADISNGNVMLRIVSISNSGCPRSYDSLKLSFDKAIDLDQGADTAICQNNSVLKLYATGANYASVAWSGGSGFFSDTSSLTPTYTPSATELTQDSFTLTLSAVPSSNLCKASSKQIKVKVLKTPTVDAGNGALICTEGGTLSLKGTSSTGAGVWSGGLATNYISSLNALDNSYKPSTTEFNAEKLTLYLSSSNNRVCNPVKDSVTFTLYKQPIEITLVGDTICNTDATATLTLNNVETGVNYQAYLGNSTNIPIGTAITGPQSSITIANAAPLQIGTNAITVRAARGVCPASLISNTAFIHINQLPDSTLALSADPLVICAGGNTAITVAKTQLGVNYELFDGNTSLQKVMGTGADLILVPIVLNTVGTHTFSVLTSVKACAILPLKNKVTVQVDPGININLQIAHPDTVCIDANPVQVTLLNTEQDVSYQIYEEETQLSTSAIVGNGANQSFKLNLAVGTHTLTIKAKNAGCSEVQLSKQPVITVNDKPNAKALTLSLDQDTVCIGSPVTLSVSPTKTPHYSYTLFVNGVAQATKAGTSVLLGFDPLNLEAGAHQLSVLESVKGCLGDTSAKILAVVLPNADTLLAQIKVSADTSCVDTTVTLQITNTQKGVKYTLYMNGVAMLPSQVAPSDGIPLNFGPVGPLSAGEYIFSATVAYGNCAAAALKSKDTLIINSRPNTKLNISDNSPICIQSDNSSKSAVVLTLKDDKESGVSYTVYRKTLNGDSLLGTFVDMQYQTDAYTVAGHDTLTVFATRKGCKAVTLDKVHPIKINKYPNLNLSSAGDTICYPSAASVKLFGTDTTWDYAVTIGSKVVAEAQGNDTLSFNISASELNKGINKVAFRIFVEGCGTRYVAKDSIVALGDALVISGPEVVCVGNTLVHTFKPVLGASAYLITLPSGQSYEQKDTSITTTWPNLNGGGRITVSPKIPSGSCAQTQAHIDVAVFDRLTGKALFNNKDTICIGSRDTISLLGLTGIWKDSLVKVDGITYLDTLSKTQGYYPYEIRYDQTGVFYHVYHLKNPCMADTTIIDTVVVLPKAIAEAGSYPVIDMKYFPREVVLDGSGSSKGGYTYKWSVTPATSVNNSTAIIASFVPEQTLQTVHLTVAHEHNGMCAATDTASIVIDLGIFIPNVFTPNGDGDHDTWLLDNVHAFYPEVSVDIFSKWGTLVYHSDGYSNAWDGTKNGSEVPAATYYYVIDLKKKGFKQVSGSVTIIR